MDGISCERSVDSDGSGPLKSSASAYRGRAADIAFQSAVTGAAIVVLLLVAAVFYELVVASQPALGRFGARFLASQSWNPVTEEFGGLASIYGTFVSTALALVIAAPLSFAIALFLVELAPPAVSSIVGGAVELLAAIPSIIYGIWGLFVLAPIMSKFVQPRLAAHLGGLPLFGRLFEGTPMGIGMLTAGFILALMVLPYISAVMRDVLKMMPPILKESAYGMGATTWEVIRKVTIPYGLRGLIGAIFLGLGRALGETMAVTFVIGNDHGIRASLFAPGTTIAATLANEFSEATSPTYQGALIELGLVLFVMTLIIQSIAQLWMLRLAKADGR